MLIEKGKPGLFRRSLAPWLFAGVLLLIAAGAGWSTSGAAEAPQRIWREPPERVEPLLPSGFAPLPSLSGLVKRLRPAVVNIYTTQVIKPGAAGRFHHPFFEDFFSGPRREYKSPALGSGFIVSPDGYILTNHHVVARASEIKVKLADERTLDAKMIGGDQKTDIALLKVEPRGELPAVYLGDSEALEVGDWVVAIGNPFGLGHTVTTGIISGKDRVLGHGPYDDFLQTDASINPGNSGGPLFDTRGHVVGINTAIVAGGSGIGFAVPINLAKELLPQLRSEGKVTRGWLGVSIQNMEAELAEKFGLRGKDGALVAQVFAGSPAEKAGMQAGDVILSIQGREVKDVRELTRRIAALPPGTVARVEAVRDGKRRTFRIKLGERERGEALARGEEPRQESGKEQEARHLGLTLAPLTPERARRLGVAESLQGLVVTDVDASGPSADIVRKGDIVLEVDRKRVRTNSDFARQIASGKGSVLLRLQRGDNGLYVVIKR